MRQVRTRENEHQDKFPHAVPLAAFPVAHNDPNKFENTQEFNDP